MYDNAFEDHFALRGRDIGPCRKMTGKVKVLLVYVDTPNHRWGDAEKEEIANIRKTSFNILIEQAKRYGQKLDLTYADLEFTIPVEYDKDGEWYQYILKNSYKVANMDVIQQRYRRALHVDSAPMIFLFNSREGNKVCQKSANDASVDDEYCAFFCNTETFGDYFANELLRLFGAVDMNDCNDEGVRAIAEKYFPDSIMLDESDKVDELTAFLVGWTDTLTENVSNFLKETEGLRQ
jgi:hypothetical protein